MKYIFQKLKQFCITFDACNFYCLVNSGDIVDKARVLCDQMKSLKNNLVIICHTQVLNYMF